MVIRTDSLKWNHVNLSSIIDSVMLPLLQIHQLLCTFTYYATQIVKTESSDAEGTPVEVSPDTEFGLDNGAGLAQHGPGEYYHIKYVKHQYTVLKFNSL